MWIAVRSSGHTGGLLIGDVLNRTETAMPQAHCFRVSELALTAEANAVRLGNLR